MIPGDTSLSTATTRAISAGEIVGLGIPEGNGTRSSLSARDAQRTLFSKSAVYIDHVGTTGRYIMQERVRFLYSHLNFENPRGYQKTFCRECFAPVMLDARGHPHKVRTTRRVRVKADPNRELFVPNARGVTVVYAIDIESGLVMRGVSVCSKLDRFSKHSGRAVALSRIDVGKAVEIRVHDPATIKKHELHELFEEIAPLKIW